MAYGSANIDPGDDATLEVAADTIGGRQYQAVKLIDATEGSTTPLGTGANPIRTDPTGVTTQPVSLTVPTASSATEGRATVNTTAGGTQILAANANRKYAEVRVALGASQGCYIARNIAADTTSRYYAPGDRIELVNAAHRYTGAVYGYVASGTCDVEYTEL